MSTAHAHQFGPISVKIALSLLCVIRPNFSGQTGRRSEVRFMAKTHLVIEF